MNSLIFLMGQGFTPNLDPLSRLAVGVPLYVVGCIILYFLMKNLWPRDKW